MCGPEKGFQRDNETIKKGAGKMNGAVFAKGVVDANPGPGGWGAAYIVDGKIAAEKSGSERMTTSNRMSLEALTAGMLLVPHSRPSRKERTIVYSDSQYAIRAITCWAGAWSKSWRSHGTKRPPWTRRDLTPVKNSDLIHRA